jgi:hypothetical protein
MVQGSCLCGKVRYEISGALYEMHHCHCGMCRKAHGAAFSTFIRVDAEGFRYSSGSDDVRTYPSSEPVTRQFCGTCGSNLTFAFAPMPQALWVTAGTMDGDPGVRPEGHIFVASKAPWFEINDSLHQHPEYPPMPEI